MGTTGIFVKGEGGMVEKQIPLEEAVEIYKEDPEKLYSDFFFRKMRRVRKWQRPLGAKFAEFMKVKSVVDFGCAAGYYLEGMMEQGASVLGFEYAYDKVKPYIPKPLAPFIRQGDVQQPIDLDGQTFDLAMSIEVAEHILPEKGDVFVENLTKASHRYVFISAATPGSGGTGHINEQPLQYWIEKVEARGFRYLDLSTKVMRSLARKLPMRVHPYMKKKTMLFEKT